MNQKKVVTIVFVVITIVFAYTFLPIISKTPVVATTFRGDGTFTIYNGNDVALSNGILINLYKTDKLEKGTDLYGSPVGVYKYPSDVYEYPGGSEVGALLLINSSRLIFLSPTNSEQQIIERGNSTDFIRPGVIMKLLSVDKDRGEAKISFQSIKGNFDLNNSSIVIPTIAIIMAILVFTLEFIIKRRSVNTLYRYTFFRSIIYTIICIIAVSLLVATSSDPEGGMAVVIFSPYILIGSLTVSFLAYLIAIKRKLSN